LVETRMFPIAPYFPPYDTDVDGSHWITVLDQLIALDPAIAVPGHGEVADVTLIREVRDYLDHIRSEAARLRASGASPDNAVATIDQDVRARLRLIGHQAELNGSWSAVTSKSQRNLSGSRTGAVANAARTSSRGTKVRLRSEIRRPIGVPLQVIVKDSPCSTPCMIVADSLGSSRWVISPGHALAYGHDAVLRYDIFSRFRHGQVGRPGHQRNLDVGRWSPGQRSRRISLAWDSSLRRRTMSTGTVPPLALWISGWSRPVAAARYHREGEPSCLD
jgi:hypothetical protein